MVATTAAPLGAGLYAANSAVDSYDLVLDGFSEGTGDLFLSSRQLTYFSDLDEILQLRNGGTGSFTLEVGGTVEGTFVGSGAGLYGVPSDAHTHDAATIETGTFADGMIAAAIARDSEVFGVVTASDGTGSGLDADLLDGLSSTANQTTGAFGAHTGALVPIDAQFPTYTQISSLPLSAGSWVVIASTEVRQTTAFIEGIPQTTSVSCRLTIGGVQTDFRKIRPPGLIGAPGYLVNAYSDLTLLGGRTLVADSTAIVECGAVKVDAEAEAVAAAWEAIRVDTLQIPVP